MQLVPAAGQVSKIIYNLQFGADAIALRKDGGKTEGESEIWKMGGTTSVKLAGHRKRKKRKGSLFDFFPWSRWESCFPA